MNSIQATLAFLAVHAEWFVGGSLLGIIVGIVFVPVLLLRIPPDYFTSRRRRAVAATRRHPLMHLALSGAKNLLGAILVAAGLVLLVLPGQGLITLFAGLIVMNYPGKFALERWIIRRPRVLPALNWLRIRYGRAALLAPDDEP